MVISQTGRRQHLQLGMRGSGTRRLSQLCCRQLQTKVFHIVLSYFTCPGPPDWATMGPFPNHFFCGEINGIAFSCNDRNREIFSDYLFFCSNKLVKKSPNGWGVFKQLPCPLWLFLSKPMLPHTNPNWVKTLQRGLPCKEAMGPCQWWSSAKWYQMIHNEFPQGMSLWNRLLVFSPWCEVGSGNWTHVPCSSLAGNPCQQSYHSTIAPIQQGVKCYISHTIL